MNGFVIAAGVAALFVFPLVAYGLVWFASRDHSGGRPNPPETNSPQRNIPGQDGD